MIHLKPEASPAPVHTLGLGCSPSIPHAWTLGFRTWAEPPGLADCVFLAQSFQHPVPGAMEPRAVADALETGEEDAVTEALRSFNREVRGCRGNFRKRGSSGERATRLGCACKCGSEHGGGWWAGPLMSLVGQVYGRREWALPYVQSDGCCFRGRSRPAALARGAQVLPACGSEPPGSPCSIPRASPSMMPSRRTGR